MKYDEIFSQIADSNMIIETLAAKFGEDKAFPNWLIRSPVIKQPSWTSGQHDQDHHHEHHLPGKEMPAQLSAEQKNVQHAMVAMVENHLHWWVRWLSKYHHDGDNKDDVYDEIMLMILKVVSLSYLLLQPKWYHNCNGYNRGMMTTATKTIMTLLLVVSLARKCCHFQQYSQSAHFHPAWSPDDEDGDGGSGNDDEDSGGGN